MTSDRMPDQPSEGDARVPRPQRPSAGDLVIDERGHRSPPPIAVAVAVAEDDGPSFADREQTLAGGEQTLADSEQTLSDADQTSSDADQTSSDSDQTSADSDQWAADRDQAASDRDLAAGGDPREHEIGRDIRRQAAHQREQTAGRRGLTAQERLAAAAARDAVADARDVAALARDRAAAARDLAMAQRDGAYEQVLGARALGADVIRAPEQRRRAAQHHTRAAEQRLLAARDRQQAADDREQAARERRWALLDRERLARQLTIAETDPLTGARTRAAGLTDLDRELDRCLRTGAELVVAYVDVIGLKTLNDTQGHSAGDALLTRIVTLVRTHLRSYDLIVRLGGDEFLCAMSAVTLPDARRRFSAITAALADAPGAGAIRTGFAELTPDETATDLIARADREMVARRRSSWAGLSGGAGAA